MSGGRLREPVRFLVFSASLRRDSLNTKLADLAAAAIEANGGDVDRRGACATSTARPTTSTCRTSEGSRPAPRSSGACLEACDGFVVASPEYNASMPGMLKNAIDWVVPLSAAAVQRAPRAADVGVAVDGRRQPRPVGAARAVRASRGALYPDMFSLAQAHKAFDRGGPDRRRPAEQRFDTNIVNFMDLVEASTHYPCVKRAWVEYLGEHPEPAIDRVE